MTNAPHINEAVNFLDKFSPATLRRLQQELPQLGEAATLGGLASVHTDPSDLTARAKFSQGTLPEVNAICDQGIGHTQQQLKRAKQLTLFGSLTAAVGSASVVTSLAASHPAIGLVSGGISLAGSLATLLATTYTKLPNSEGSVSEVYQSLMSLKVEARLLEEDLRYWLGATTKAEREAILADLINKTNDFLRKAYELTSKLELTVLPNKS